MTSPVLVKNDSLTGGMCSPDLLWFLQVFLLYPQDSGTMRLSGCTQALEVIKFFFNRIRGTPVETTYTNFLQLVPPALVVIFLLYFSYTFYIYYFKPSQGLDRTLRRISGTLASMKEGDADLRKIGASRVFRESGLDRLWAEFSKTLHVQHLDSGGKIEKRARLTVPARAYFSVSAVIEGPLRAHYFKHLPGILTGVGIIGTFSGLLFGLSNFDSSSPDTMAQSVNLLLSGVRDAFYASALAITVAMVITHMEKLQYRKCVSALDELNSVVDSLFDSGVEQEYLAAIAHQTRGFENQADGFRNAITESLALVANESKLSQERFAELIRTAMFEAMTDVTRKSNAHLEQTLIRHLREPVEEMTRKIESRINSTKVSNADIASKIVRASNGSGSANHVAVSRQEQS